MLAWITAVAAASTPPERVTAALDAAFATEGVRDVLVGFVSFDDGRWVEQALGERPDLAARVTVVRVVTIGDEREALTRRMERRSLRAGSSCSTARRSRDRAAAARRHAIR